MNTNAIPTFENTVAAKLSSKEIFDLCTEQYGKRPFKSTDPDGYKMWMMRFRSGRGYAKRHGFYKAPKTSK